MTSGAKSVRFILRFTDILRSKIEQADLLSASPQRSRCWAGVQTCTARSFLAWVTAVKVRGFAIPDAEVQITLQSFR